MQSSDRRGRRRVRSGAALAFALVLAAGCSGSTAEPETALPTTVPEAQTALRVAAVDWPACLDPVRCHDEAARVLVLEHTQPRLFEIDVDGVPVASPLLAAAPDLAIDPDTGEQRITYRLSPDARWHDGRPVTSTDLLATWQTMLEGTIAADDPHRWIVDVDDRDPRTAVLILSRPVADWRQLFGGFEHWLAQADAIVDPGSDAPLAPTVGAGPFEVVTADEDRIVLSARTDHWDPERRAEIDQIRIERLPADPAAWPSLSGFDVVVGAVPADLVPLGLERRLAPEDEMVGLFLDRRTTALQRPEVRSAVASIVEHDQLLAVAGDVVPATTSCIGWLPADPACGSTTVAAGGGGGTAELEAESWLPRADGIRTRAGVSLTSPLTVGPDVDGADTVAVALRIRLRTLGADVTERPLSRAAWWDPQRSETAGVSLQRIPIGTAARLGALLACRDLTGPLAWCDGELESALAALASATSRSGRIAAAGRIAALVADEESFVPLFAVGSPYLLDVGAVTTGDPRPGRGALAALWEWEISSS